MFRFFQMFSQLIFPLVCHTCHQVLIKGERIVCMKCYLDIPRQTKITSLNVDGQSLPVYSLYRFQKAGKIQRLIHLLKYHNKKEIGIFFGEELRIRFDTFDDVNYIIPVPLHWRKKKHRGYNQSEVIANGFIKNSDIKLLCDCLKRKDDNSSQTGKKRYDRFQKIEHAFEVLHGSLLHSQHVLLIDDVFTTGATLTACIQQLHTIPGIRISILCVAK